MDHIFLKQLKLNVSIGCLPWEKCSPQAVLVDIDISTDCHKAAHTDELAATLDYVNLVEQINIMIKDRHFNLIETLAQSIAELILAQPQALEVTVTATKPEIIAACKGAGVVISRKRNPD